MRTIYHIKCTECGRVIGSGFEPLNQPGHVLCKFCAEEWCSVLDFMTGLKTSFSNGGDGKTIKSYWDYYRHVIENYSFRGSVTSEQRRNSWNICSGLWKLIR